MWTPHNEASSRKKIANILKIVIANFVCLTKIQTTFDITFFKLKIGNFLRLGGLVFCKHLHFYNRKGF